VDQVQFDIFQDIHKVHQYQVLSQFAQAIQLFKNPTYEKINHQTNLIVIVMSMKKRFFTKNHTSQHTT
jgi:uncharacterized protein YerC